VIQLDYHRFVRFICSLPALAFYAFADRQRIGGTGGSQSRLPPESPFFHAAQPNRCHRPREPWWYSPDAVVKRAAFRFSPAKYSLVVPKPRASLFATLISARIPPQAPCESTIAPMSSAQRDFRSMLSQVGR
jgi:hypothetical protein